MAAKKPNLLCLMMLISFPSVANVFISSALPQIGVFFHLGESYIQQIITLFVAGYALGHLIYSPISNQFGRKLAAYFGLAIYLLGCVVCLIAVHVYSFNVLLLGRFIMALGASSGMAITFTIINDFYTAKKIHAITSYAILSYAFMPALSVFLGGFITTHLSWLACFYAYCVYGVIMLLVIFNLPETLSKEGLSTLKIHKVIANYAHAFSSIHLVLFSAIFGLMTTFVYIIASVAPFIAINHIGMTAFHYGLLFIIPYFAQVLGSVISIKISKSKTVYTVMTIGYMSVFIGSFIMGLSFSLHWINRLSLIGSISFIMFGLPMVYSGASTIAVSKYANKAIGSAIMSFITSGIAFLAVVIFTLLPKNILWLMPLAFIVIIFVSIVLFLYGYFKFSSD